MGTLHEKHASQEDRAAPLVRGHATPVGNCPPEGIAKVELGPCTCQGMLRPRQDDNPEQGCAVHGADFWGSIKFCSRSGCTVPLGPPRKGLPKNEGGLTAGEVPIKIVLVIW